MTTGGVDVVQGGPRRLLVLHRDLDRAHALASDLIALDLEADAAHAVGPARALAESHDYSAIILGGFADARGISSILERQPQAWVVCVDGVADSRIPADFYLDGDVADIAALLHDAPQRERPRIGGVLSQILFVGDESSTTASWLRDLPRMKPTCFVDNVEDAIDSVAVQPCEVAVVELDALAEALPDAVHRLVQFAPETAVVVVLAEPDLEVELALIRAGAQECVLKSTLDSSRLLSVTQRAHERQRQRLEILSAASVDPLTGLKNRAFLLTRLRQTTARIDRRQTLHAFLVVDLDQFKTINDSMGHVAGDIVLRTMARRLLSCVRESDSVGRLGGDEFGVLLEDIARPAEALNIARRIVETLRKPVHLDDTAYRLGASVGIALCPLHTRSADQIVSFADLAMYRAKRARKGLEIFRPELHQADLRTHEIQMRLSGALERSEFALEFQPIMDKPSGSLTSAEALLRWSTDSGRVGPSEFVPMLERSGQIKDVGIWVLRRACQELASLRESGLSGLRLSVNASGTQLRDPYFGERVLDVIDGFGLKPTDIDIEITESVVLARFDAIRAVLGPLSDAGVGIVLDDFGTGRSCLKYVHELPLTGIKIDRSYVSGLPGDGKADALVRAILGLAKVFNLRVIAEGVQASAQIEHLESLGVRSFQGYYYSRPLGAASFRAWAASRVPAAHTHAGHRENSEYPEGEAPRHSGVQAKANISKAPQSGSLPR